MVRRGFGFRAVCPYCDDPFSCFAPNKSLVAVGVINALATHLLDHKRCNEQYVYEASGYTIASKGVGLQLGRQMTRNPARSRSSPVEKELGL